MTSITAREYLRELPDLFFGPAATAAADQLNLTRATRFRLLERAIREGLLLRIRQGVYAQLDETGATRAPTPWIATQVVPGSIVSHWWALGLHGLAEPRDLAGFAHTVASTHRATPFQLPGVPHKITSTTLQTTAFEIGQTTIQHDGFQLRAMTPERALIGVLCDARFLRDRVFPLQTFRSIGSKVDLQRFAELCHALGVVAPARRLGHALSPLWSLRPHELSQFRYGYSGGTALDPRNGTRGRMDWHWGVANIHLR